MNYTSVETTLKPASVSWCPYAPFETVLAVGTYQIDAQNSLRRHGTCDFYAFHSNSKQIEFICSVDCHAGVFRFKWVNWNKEPRLLAALTDGTVAVIEISQDDKQATIKKVLKVTCSRMLLSLYPDNCTTPASLLSSDNMGHLHLLDVTTEQIVSSWLAHSLPFTSEPCEVWSCAFGDQSWSMYSGADDGLLKSWDNRTNLNRPIFVNKSHGSGVTFISSHENGLWTGSYDESIRLWDVRSLQEPLKETSMGGGVWSIETQVDGTLLTACMYGGWRLLSRDFEELFSDTEIGAQLLYGVSRNPQTDSIAACTFNDSRLHVAVRIE